MRLLARKTDMLRQCWLPWCAACFTGKVMAAGARPVADAAQQLKWEGDAAFELLGGLFWVLTDTT